MSTNYAKAETLVGTLAAPLDWTRSAALVVGFSLLTALAAQVVVPLPWTPVPLTGQTFAVLLTGALLGSRMGALAMIAYLAEGALGLPFFRGGAGGAAHLLGPTAGYLVSFPIIAALVGVLAERGWSGNRIVRSFIAHLSANILCLAIGGAWLAALIGAEKGWLLGVAPFILGAVLKSALAAAVLKTIQVYSGKARLN